MERNLHHELMNENIFKSQIFPLFDVFEKYVDESVEDVEIIKADLIHCQIENLIRDLSNALKENKRKLLGRYLTSLRTNVNQFLKMPTDKPNEIKISKFEKVMMSYLSISRVIICDSKIQRGISNKDIKKILVVGTVKVEEDDIKVSDEIQRIHELSMHSEGYPVLPVLGCTLNVLETRLKEFDIDDIHISGHCDGKKLHFSDAPVTFSKLNDGYERGDIGKHADELPNGEWMTRQSFWLNNSYVLKQLEYK